MSVAAPAPPQRTFLGHPIGLFVLFFTEMWERFSYYGMRALLMLYMVNYLKMVPKDASTIYKVYTSFVYVTPILGGFLADRYLGNRRAVIIGAILMAIGHFLMAFEEYPVFLSALIFLIFGNGFFKPNMSVQVGRLYPTNDGRRDGAYTIFYMGINLGAFFSPLACGWLAENTVGSYHSGFTLAGIGMIIGLFIYLVGQPFIREIPREVIAAPTTPGVASHAALSEEQAEKAPSVNGGLSNATPALLAILGAILLATAPACYITKTLDLWDVLMLAIAGGCMFLISFVSKQVHGGMRDRVLTILMLGIFVVFFWAAFEQAGNVLNLWADQQTNRFLTEKAPEAGVIPEVHEDAPKNDGGEPARVAGTGILDRLKAAFVNMVTMKPNRKTDEDDDFSKWLTKSVNPAPTAWFQAINALAIFLIAPIFAWMWIALDRRSLQPSIPLKMTIGLLLVSGSMVVMSCAANQENQRTTMAYKNTALPKGIELTDKNQVAIKRGEVLEPTHAGRLLFDAKAGQFVVDGVLAESDRDQLIQSSAPKAYRENVEKLQEASKKINGTEVKSAEVDLGELPPGFDLRYAGIKKSVVSLQGTKLVVQKTLAEKDTKGLLKAAGDPAFRDAVNEMFQKSAQLRVTPWWLVWSYILATLGELCLSPVGLSMVSKLAPAKFATMLMGVWMLTSAFGNFVAGALGEKLWGTLPPIQFFLLAAAVVGAAGVVLFLLCRRLVAMMHGVN